MMARFAPTPTIFTSDEVTSVAFLKEKEWLITNGLGGYASGTLLGLPTRRYHGLFIPNLPAPRGRTVMLPRLDDSLMTNSGPVMLSAVEFRDGRVEGAPQHYLEEFRHEWLVPAWTFNIAGRRLRKRMIMPHGQNTIYVEYELLDGPAIDMTIRPYFCFRGHDESFISDEGWPFTLTVNDDRCEVTPFPGAPTVRIALRPQTGAFVVERASEEAYYEVEDKRGQDCKETLKSPGFFSFKLAPGFPVAMVASTEPWEFITETPEPIFEAERRRLEKLLLQAPVEARSGFTAQLVLAADQFIILPGSRLEELAMLEVGEEPVRTVVAGYHWFTDWGRDTMISLEGLTLCTGRYEQARAILKTFSHYISKGLIPNHFPEGRRTAIYNTADATLWYFHALDRYCEITRDTGLIRELFPILKSIIKHHFEGTDFGIGMDPSDGLLRASADGLALSWMDAKVDGWVVTPRRGKPVEIQALWYNALRLMRMWAHNLNEQDEVYERAAEQVFDSFNDRYWNESAAALYDVIDGPEGNDGSLRPNQLFAISLHFPVLKQEKWKTVLNTTTEQLLTPVGLRTLSAQDPQYKSRYEGNRMSRDAAYHQGLVWPWLMGALFDAVQKIDSNLDRIESILNQYQQQTREKCVGTVPEVYDAEPPYRPGGCIAQAWSVAEVLRILLTLKRDRIRFPARTIAVEHRIS